jgi:hypothetical protein
MGLWARYYASVKYQLAARGSESIVGLRDASTSAGCGEKGQTHIIVTIRYWKARGTRNSKRGWWIKRGHGDDILSLSLQHQWSRGAWDQLYPLQGAYLIV